jgi:four helix bundle protein
MGQWGMRRGLRHVAWQLADAAGSVASNHRAMRRSRSEREFAAKLQIVNEEVDESALWLEIALAVLERIGQGPAASSANSSVSRDDVSTILREARELRSIFAKARATLRHCHDS